MKNIIIIILALSLLLCLFSNTHILIQHASAQNISSSSILDTQNTNENLNTEYKTYILIFGQRTIGNVDNSTKIVSSIVGHNLIKIEEEFLEEISLAPSQQLEIQVEKVINDGINGKECGVNLTTQQDQNVVVDCISSGNTLIWYIHPTK
ncbi:MAG TPA: hypothetical protein VEW92_10100 [Nitrososphaeraceae archaeon]|jgi:hypothetical protein|nr:hypothetical protein [Nitrososphaeraceae archaeon]